MTHHEYSEKEERITRYNVKPTDEGVFLEIVSDGDCPDYDGRTHYPHQVETVDLKSLTVTYTWEILPLPKIEAERNARFISVPKPVSPRSKR